MTTVRNAVEAFAHNLNREALQGIWRKVPARSQFNTPSTRLLRQRVVRAYEDSLAQFLNHSSRGILEGMCRTYKLSDMGSIGQLRYRLWHLGAMQESADAEMLGTAVQPIPDVFGEKLVYPGAVCGLVPPAQCWPRPIPDTIAPFRPPGEPESLEELLANADALLGLRLGQAGVDKGAFGTRIAELLGVPERGFAEADWRGEVEIKTVSVVLGSKGDWRVKEDPAITMAQVDPRVKLTKVLWIARVHDEDSPILSWYYQEWDAHIEQLASEYLHHRPKGPAGTDNKGWYLQKRFFLYSGFLRSLNG